MSAPYSGRCRDRTWPRCSAWRTKVSIMASRYSSFHWPRRWQYWHLTSITRAAPDDRCLAFFALSACNGCDIRSALMRSPPTVRRRRRRRTGIVARSCWSQRSRRWVVERRIVKSWWSATTQVTTLFSNNCGMERLSTTAWDREGSALLLLLLHRCCARRDKIRDV